MSVFSELSVLEMDAEWGELLPEREALQTVTNVTPSTTNLNIATVNGVLNSVTQVTPVEETLSVSTLIPTVSMA